MLNQSHPITQKQLVVLFLLTLICTANSCRKNRILKDPEVPELPEQEVPDKKRLLPVRITSGQEQLSFKYKDSLLIQLDHKDGYTLKIDYDQHGQPRELKKYKKDKLLQGVYFYLNERGILYKLNRFNYQNLNATYIGYELIAQHPLQQSINVKAYDHNDQLIREVTHTYKTGNKISSSAGGTALPDHYTYDDQPGIFKHIPHAELLFPEAGFSPLYPGTNNIRNLSFGNKPSENLEFSYTYNKAGYPTTIVQMKAKTSQEYKVSYE